MSASQPAAGATASSSPSAASASATPGQPAAGGPPPAGVTLIRFSVTAAMKPTMAMPQPTPVTQVRRVGSATATSASPNPTVTQTGGGAGPPGLSASSCCGPSPVVVRPAVCTPASVTNEIGSVSRCSDHGKSTKNGTTATMAAFTGSAASSQRRAASTPSANTTPRIQA